MKIGAQYSRDKTEFTVWAPHQKQVSLLLPKENQVLKMYKIESGYWTLKIDGIKPETRYLFRLDDGKDRPDPASHFQPDGVFRASAVVDHTNFSWKDNGWSGIKLEDMIMYELHVGTFTLEGTFAAARQRAKDLTELGVNAVELMPVSQFSGSRNWGYDGVFPFAVQNNYGGPEELKKLVDGFHAAGLAVILDVVYNHIGPEGNFLGDFGPYFRCERKGPWGLSINFDGKLSLPVRNFFLENSVHWFENYHIDGLRLDAVYAIIDNSPKHFLEELSETIEKIRFNRKKLLLIAENDCVDTKIISPRKSHGFGLDAVWHDNLHHSLHALLTDERNWYYGSFGSVKQLKDALKEEYVKCQSSKGKLEVCSDRMIAPSKLVVFSQNHDQIGNRPMGKRLISLSGFEAAKLAAGMVVLTQYTPLFFMGEEYGENAPFMFFTDFSDEKLGKKVRNGRKKELKKNGWKENTLDPQNPKTFKKSKIYWLQRSKEQGKKTLEYYQTLIRLRKDFADSDPNKLLKIKFYTLRDESLLVTQKQNSESTMVTVANFSKEESHYNFPFGEGQYIKVLDSAESAWLGPGSMIPERAKLGDKHTICPLSMSVFLNRKAENNG